MRNIIVVTLTVAIWCIMNCCIIITAATAWVCVCGHLCVWFMTSLQCLKLCVLCSCVRRLCTFCGCFSVCTSIQGESIFLPRYVLHICFTAWCSWFWEICTSYCKFWALFWFSCCQLVHLYVIINLVVKLLAVVFLIHFVLRVVIFAVVTKEN